MNDVGIHEGLSCEVFLYFILPLTVGISKSESRRLDDFLQAVQQRSTTVFGLTWRRTIVYLFVRVTKQVQWQLCPRRTTKPNASTSLTSQCKEYDTIKDVSI